MLDDAESLRRKRHTTAALELVDRVLDLRPAEPRALLLKSRLDYQSGNLRRALDDLTALETSLGRAELAPLRTALERLDEDAHSGPAFATESMALLLERQGYRLEALEVYRQLYETASNRDELREEIVRLKDAVGLEGSRDASDERARREVEIWQRWLEEHPRGV